MIKRGQATREAKIIIEGVIRLPCSGDFPE